MPVYPMICPDCDTTFDLVASMNGDKIHECSCGSQMVRNWQESNVHTSGDYSRAIHSDSLAIAPSQRIEHQRNFPDVKLDNEHRPVFDNYRQHDAYLEKTGFRKKRQRIRHRSRKATP